METSQEAKAYQRIKHRLFAAGLALSLFLLCLIVFSGLAISLKEILEGATQNTVLLNGLYLTSLSAIFYLIGFPLSFYEDFILEHRFHLSNQGLASYLKDNLKKSAISLVITLIAGECLYLFLAKFPQGWWLLAAGAWFFLTVVLTKITPSVILPLFFKYIPLENPDLKNKIKGMFLKANTGLKDIYVINFSAKTNKLNAAVVGLGKNRKVILADNLLSELSDDEILSIVGHELGHYKNKDSLKIIFFGACLSLVLFFLSDLVLRRLFYFFGYSSIADIAGLPLFCLVMLILGFFNLPIQNAFIRRLERKADIFSLSSAKSSGAFISMMEKLAKRNLSDLNPGRFIEIMFYDHPPVGRRIKLALEHKGE